MERLLTEIQFDRFSRLIYEQSGIHFSQSNRSILESRLRERLQLVRLDQVEEYYDRIVRDASEMQVFLDSVTTNLTRFFRNAGHFQTFERFVLPDLLDRRAKAGPTKLRIWSAGCSTGEEPYSIAMVMADKVPRTFTFEVIASDISLKSLLVAGEGFYPEARVAGVPAPYLQRFFERKRDGYLIDPAIKKLVRFDYHNLKHESGLSGIDVVFCRNVLIYFDAAAQKATIERICKAMNAYSYLFIGHSESLFGMGTPFEFVRTDWATLYRKNPDA